MTSSNIILQGTTIDEFLDLLSEKIIEKIESKYKIKSEKELLSIEECARKRGVSTQTIRNWMKNRKLKRYRMGKRVFLDYSEITQKLAGE
jgi:excisionase family DNA binding protein